MRLTPRPSGPLRSRVVAVLGVARETVVTELGPAGVTGLAAAPRVRDGGDRVIDGAAGDRGVETGLAAGPGLGFVLARPLRGQQIEGLETQVECFGIGQRGELGIGVQLPRELLA
jgi:hypothetical protein